MKRKILLITSVMISLYIASCSEKGTRGIHNFNRITESTIEEGNGLDEILQFEITDQDSYDDSIVEKTINNSLSSLLFLDSKKGDVQLVGSQQTSNGTKVVLLKINEVEQIVWERLISKNSKTIINDVILSQDGNIILNGNNRLSGFTTNDAYIIELTKAGNEIWSSSYGTDGFETSRDILQMGNGTIILIGNSIKENEQDNSRIYLVKINNKGELLDQKFIDKKCLAIGNSIVEGPNESIIFLAIEEDCESSGKTLLKVYAYSKEFKEIWQRNIGEAKHRTDLMKINENEYLVFIDNPLQLIRIDKRGNIKWRRSYDIKEGDVISGISGHSIKRTGENGFIVIGERRIIGDSYQVKALLLKVDNEGNIIWKKEFGTEKLTMISDIYLNEVKKEIICVGFTSNLESSTQGQNIVIRLDFNGEPK